MVASKDLQACLNSNYSICWSSVSYLIGTQVALIYNPSKQCQTSINITSFLLADFLDYNNNAMNPILYAFLSNNFKKSFLKTCTCAGKDGNTMHNENSVFPRRKINTDRSQTGRKIAAGLSRINFDDEETEKGLFGKKLPPSQ